MIESTRLSTKSMEWTDLDLPFAAKVGISSTRLRSCEASPRAAWVGQGLGPLIETAGQGSQRVTVSPNTGGREAGAGVRATPRY